MVDLQEEMEELVSADVRNESSISGASSQKTIYLLSDNTGETSQKLISSLLVQYHDTRPSVRLRANVRTQEQVEMIVDEVASSGCPAMIFATIVDPQLRQVCEDLCSRMGVRWIDVMSPLVGAVESFLRTRACCVPGGIADIALATEELVDEELYNRIEAVQYTQQHLLGLNRHEWKDADLLLLGMSRVGKVSLAFYLAQLGVKVACMDLRVGMAVPQELSDLDPKKVLVIDMQANVVARRRANRIADCKSNAAALLFDRGYTDLASVRAEQKFVKELVRKHPSWHGPVDLTHNALEERAVVILRTARLRGH